MNDIAQIITAVAGAMLTTHTIAITWYRELKKGKKKKKK